MENGGSETRVKREAERIGEEMQDRLEGMRGERIREFARERPLAAIGIAMGVGFLLGRLLSRA